MRRLVKSAVLLIFVVLSMAFVVGDNTTSEEPAVVAVQKETTIDNYLVLSNLSLNKSQGSYSVLMVKDNGEYEVQSAQKAGILLDFSNLVNEKPTVGQPVEWRQNLTVTNTGNETRTFILDLSHQLTETFVQELVSNEIGLEGDFVSDSLSFLVQIEAGDSQAYSIDYTTSPVLIEVNCTNITIQDLLPPDAEIITTEIDPGTVVETTCDVKIYNPLSYPEIEVATDNFNLEDIDSVYYVEEDKFIDIVGGKIDLVE